VPVTRTPLHSLKCSESIQWSAPGPGINFKLLELGIPQGLTKRHHDSTIHWQCRYCDSYYARDHDSLRLATCRQCPVFRVRSVTGAGSPGPWLCRLFCRPPEPRQILANLPIDAVLARSLSHDFWAPVAGRPGAKPRRSKRRKLENGARKGNSSSWTEFGKVAKACERPITTAS
jgi:hypothetical protein